MAAFSCTWLYSLYKRRVRVAASRDVSVSAVGRQRGIGSDRSCHHRPTRAGLPPERSSILGRGEPCPAAGALVDASESTLGAG